MAPELTKGSKGSGHALAVNLTGALRPYPEYKDSGVPWLDQIPSHWEVRRNGRLFSQRNEKGRPDLPILEVSLGTGVTIRDVEGGKRKQVLTEREGYKRAAKGDIAYNTMRMWQGAVGVAPTDGLVSPVYVVARPRAEAVGRYFSYLFRTSAYMSEVNNHSRGIVADRNRLYWEDFRQIPGPFPPIEEQNATADVLDAHGRLTSRFIRAKRRLIELLNEQKQAIIHRAVTRGLDPNVRFKPSGIDWLGDVPEHWEVKRLRSLSTFVTSGSRGWARFYSDNGPIFLRIGNISTESVDLKLSSIQRVKPPAGGEGQRTQAKADDILISITALIGAVGIVPDRLGEAYVNQHTALVRLAGTECIPRWVAYCLLSSLGKRQCQLLTNGGTKEGLGLDDVKNLRVLMPPTGEQADIVGRIDCELGDTDNAIAVARRQIDLLREHRTRLIADVVTGKLDVRGVELPALDEAEPVDDAALGDEEAGEADLDAATEDAAGLPEE